MDLSVAEYLDVIRAGLAKQVKLEGRPKKVVIVGAGMAGLVAAYELKRAGHSRSSSRRSSAWVDGCTRCAIPSPTGYMPRSAGCASRAPTN